MLGTKELIEEARALPVEERVLLVDSLLKSLNPTNDEVDGKWGAETRRRLAELKSGQVKAVPGDEVFAKVWKRFST